SSNRVHNSSGYIRINNSHQVPISIPYSGLYQVLLNYENEEIERYFRVFDKITHAIGSQQADYSHIDFYTTNNSPTPYTDILDEFKDKIKQALLTYSDPGKYLAASPQSCDWKTYLNLQGNNLPVTYDVILLNDTPRFEWLNTDNGTGSIISAPGVQVERLPYSLNPTQNYHEHLVFHIPYIVSQISKRPYTLNQYIESLSLHEVFHSFQSSYQLVPNEISGKYFFFYEGMATAATFWEMKDEEKLLLEDSNGEIQFSCYKSAERQFYIKLAKDEFGHLFQGCRTPKDLTYGGAVFWRFLLEKGVKNHPNALGAPERVLTKFMEGVYWSSNAYDQNNVHEMLEDGYNYLLSPYGYNDCMVYQSFEELMQAYSEYAVTQALKLDNLLTDENVNEFLFGHNGLYQIYVPSAIDEGLTINNTMVPGVFGFDCYEIDIVGASFTRYDLKHDLANEPVSISILYEYDDGEENINRYEIDRIIKDELSSCIIDIADEEISNIKKIYVIISQYGQISTSGDLVKLQALKRPFNTSFSLDSTSSMADMSLFYSDPLTVQVTHPSAIYLA
ncbi:MAG: hypothetical protein P9L91_00635, partial [Candidatus Zophobacter franzmannii]|nr:hypothetical protein [Candidatus Zophobacter franzmannii]